MRDREAERQREREKKTQRVKEISNPLYFIWMRNLSHGSK